jgi:hypothetical protein
MVDNKEYMSECDIRLLYSKYLDMNKLGIQSLQIYCESQLMEFTDFNDKEVYNFAIRIMHGFRYADEISMSRDEIIKLCEGILIEKKKKLSTFTYLILSNQNLMMTACDRYKYLLDVLLHIAICIGHIEVAKVAAFLGADINAIMEWHKRRPVGCEDTVLGPIVMLLQSRNHAECIYEMLEFVSKLYIQSGKLIDHSTDTKGFWIYMHICNHDIMPYFDFEIVFRYLVKMNIISNDVIGFLQQFQVSDPKFVEKLNRAIEAQIT